MRGNDLTILAMVFCSIVGTLITVISGQIIFESGELLLLIVFIPGLAITIVSTYFVVWFYKNTIKLPLQGNYMGETFLSNRVLKNKRK